MRWILLTLLAFATSVGSSVPALADKPVTPAEAERIQAALKDRGCSGGEMEQETDATGIYEVDDAVCGDGQYDITLDKDFKITSMRRD
jgi:hypothetical protein